MVRYGKTKRGGYVSKYYKTPASKRRFAGKLFNIMDISHNKKEAQKLAAYWKNKGKNIRIIKTADRWCIYTRD